MIRSATAAFFAVMAIAFPVQAHDPMQAHDVEARATYLGNEGVLIVQGDVKLLFDPLFDEAYGQYQLVPDDIRAAVMAGDPPYDGVRAVFVSHAHGDHFSAAPMLAYLRAHPSVRLFAPEQAREQLFEEAGETDAALDRVIAFDIAPGDAPVQMNVEGLAIDVIAVPHSGGERHAGVRNLIFRVTLDEAMTVVHMGDADPQDAHFAPHQDHWDAKALDLALPPYWFFSSEEGRSVLEVRLRPRQSVGVHVPVSASIDPVGARAQMGADLFIIPGEERLIGAPE